MERIARKPFQGVTNIVRFNWHFYVLFILLFVVLIVATKFVPPAFYTAVMLLVLLMAVGTLLSLAVSFYVYDCSGLYNLHWLDSLNISRAEELVNINAGFDETSILLVDKYPDAHISAFDFYDPLRHTEVSIKRARKAYPPYPGTRSVTTTDASFIHPSADTIFAILAAHEIRDTNERIGFFKALKRGLKPGGKIVVVEHLRDLPNFIAYNIGFLHFHSYAEWKRTFDGSGLVITNEKKITPFIHVFILQ